MNFHEIQRTIQRESDEAQEKRRQAALQEQRESNRLYSLQQQLSQKALDSVATDDDPEAWNYLQQKGRFTPETWALIQERLPKLLAIQQDETEVYLMVNSFIEGDFGDQIDFVKLIPSHQLEITFGSSGPKVKDIPDIWGVQIAIGYPTPKPSWKEPFIEHRGALLGHEEVKEFVESIQNDPMYKTLLYNVSLELMNSPTTVPYWHALPDSAKAEIVATCFNFLEFLPQQYGDQYSPVVAQFPKIMKLLGIEAGVEDPEDISNNMRQIAKWRANATHSESETYRLISEAHWHWQEMKNLNLHALEW